MAKNCTVCGASNRDSAGKCQACGAEFLSGGTPWWLIAVGLVLVLGFGLWGCSALLGGDEGEAEAIAACRAAIGTQLRSPASASYTEFETTQIAMGWRIRGYVDADNAFGASIRGSYTCLVEELSGSWVATVANLSED